MRAALEAVLTDGTEQSVEQVVGAMWAMHRDMMVLLGSWDALAKDMTRFKRPEMAEGIALCARQMRIFLESHE